MIFIYPMWDSEAQRIGKQKCTKLGYDLHAVADLLGAIGLYTLVIMIGVFIYQYLFSGGEYFSLWYFMVPFVLGIIGNIIFYVSWTLAYKKSFKYDDENRESSWIEDGVLKTFTL